MFCLIFKVKYELRLIDFFFILVKKEQLYFCCKCFSGNIVYSSKKQVEMNSCQWKFAFFTFGNYYVFRHQF